MWFGVLGPLLVTSGDAELTVTSPKQRVVLAGLALRANQLVPAERMLRFLWDEAPPPSALTALRTHVAGVRKALRTGDGGVRAQLVTMPRGYMLRAEQDEIDVLQFERLLAIACQHMDGQEFENAANVLKDALSLWRGRPLADVDSTVLVRADVARLEERRLFAVELHVRAELACGRHAGMISDLRALTSAYPLHEGFRAQLMMALYRAGRRGEALDAYQDARQVISEELGLDPSPDLRNLHQAVLLDEPFLRATSGPPRPGCTGTCQWHCGPPRNGLLPGHP